MEDFTTLSTIYKKSLSYSHTTNSRPLQASTLGSLGVAQVKIGFVREGIENLHQSLAVNNSIGNFYGEVYILNNIVATYQYFLGSSLLFMLNQHTRCQDNMKQVIVRVNDRGPYSHADIDLSYSAFAHIQSTSKGNATVCWRVVG